MASVSPMPLALPFLYRPVPSALRLLGIGGSPAGAPSAHAGRSAFLLPSSFASSIWLR